MRSGVSNTSKLFYWKQDITSVRAAVLLGFIQGISAKKKKKVTMLSKMIIFSHGVPNSVEPGSYCLC